MDIQDVRYLQELMRNKKWTSVYELLDSARASATTKDDLRRTAYWRVVALQNQERHEEAIEQLRANAAFANSQCLFQHNLAHSLEELGRNREAIDELAKAPFEAEIEKFYGLAIDAKFYYFYLMAKNGDMSVKSRLSEIPDDYRHITRKGTFLLKADIESLLK